MLIWHLYKYGKWSWFFHQWCLNSHKIQCACFRWVVSSAGITGSNIFPLVFYGHYIIDLFFFDIHPPCLLVVSVSHQQFQPDLLQYWKAFTDLTRLTFLLVCFLSVTLLHLSFKVFPCLSLSPICGESSSSGFLSSSCLRSLLFSPSSIYVSPPYHIFQTIPASPSISSISSNTFFSFNCYPSRLICLCSSLVPLQRVLKFIKKLLQMFTSLQQPFLLFYTSFSSPPSSLLTPSLFSHSRVFHLGFGWCLLFFYMFHFPSCRWFPYLQYNIISLFPNVSTAVVIAYGSLSFDWNFFSVLFITPCMVRIFCWCLI